MKCSGLFISMAGVLIMTSGCSIHEVDMDNQPTYKVRFSYDNNLSFTNLIASEVSKVTLSLIDADGFMVSQDVKTGAELAASNYEMQIDAKPGTYNMVAWCTTNEGDSYTFGEGRTRSALNCSVNRKIASDGSQYTDAALADLYHGIIKDAVLPEETGTYCYDIDLIKDTNRVHVLLQNVNGTQLTSSNFEVSITDNNGLMAYDNTLLDDQPIKYKAYKTSSASTSFSTDGLDTQSVETMSAVAASVNTVRLMEDHDPRLSIYKTDDTTGLRSLLLSIPLIDYAKLLKTMDSKDMSDQEYLDRQDQYNITFFLDDSERWLNSYIYINSWRIVLNDTEF
jgi:hypothetical protein